MEKMMKQAYSAPHLTVHGTVEAVTQTGNGHFEHGNGNGYGHCKHAGQNPGHMEDPLGGCGLS